MNMPRLTILIGSLWAAMTVNAFAGPVVPSPAATITGIPTSSDYSFFVGVRYNQDGLLYVNDGIGIWRQTEVNGSQFTQIGQISGVPDDSGSGSYANSSDAGPINFSQDGSRILIGNGAGGWKIYMGEEWHNGRLFSMPVNGGTVSQPVGDIDWHYDLIAVSARSTMPDSASKYFINHGVDTYMTDAKSHVSVFDETTGMSQKVIANIPGASASIAVDANGNLYACSGYGDTRGLIKYFEAAAVDEAYALGQTLDWEDGTPLNPDNYNNTSGAGMFFDARGYLFVGGNEGVTVFRPNGTSETYDIGKALLGYTIYSSLAYNPLLDQILVMTYGASQFYVFNAADFLAGEFPASVPEPSSLLLVGLGAVGLMWYRRRTRV